MLLGGWSAETEMFAFVISKVCESYSDPYSSLRRDGLEVIVQSKGEPEEKIQN
jgi:hypothetical protein